MTHTKEDMASETYTWAPDAQGAKDGPGMLAAGSPLPVSLEDKLATMVWYLDEVRSGRRQADPKAFESYLDDPEVAGWLDKMNKAGRIRNTRFISN